MSPHSARWRCEYVTMTILKYGRFGGTWGEVQWKVDQLKSRRVKENQNQNQLVDFVILFPT